MQHTPSDRRTRRWRVAIAGALLCAAASAQALTVMTCEPEWAALVRQLAPAADVRSATHARQDPHHIEARPSLIALARKADLVVCTGASLEEGWLPTLLERSGNRKVQAGMPGLFFAADQVSLIDPRPAAGPFAGDVHAAGNPHLHLDPRRLQQVADLEPKPGVPPTPGHLQAVLAATRDAPPRAVVVSAYQDPRGAQWLTQQLGPRTALLQLPSTVTEEPPADSLAALFDHLLDRLLGAPR